MVIARDRPYRSKPTTFAKETTAFSTLISVHFPKSAGLSLRAAYLKAFGEKRVLFDYADDPADPQTGARPYVVHRRRVRRNQLREACVVHGHFAIKKYDDMLDCHRAVMLRDPVDNLISIYYFWNYLADAGHLGGHALFKQFLAERPSLLAFARIPTLRRLMSQTYFGGFAMERFDVIGDFARRDAYYAAVSDLMGVTLDASLQDNRSHRSAAREQTQSDHRLVAALRDILRDDVLFFERWAGKNTSHTAFFETARAT